MPTLAEAGFSLTEILDFDRGLTLDEFFDFQLMAARQLLRRERRLVEDTVVALASLFQPKVLDDFRAEVARIEATLEQGFSEAPGVVAASQAESVSRSLRELSKLVEAGIIRRSK